MDVQEKNLYIIAGCNGAGKTTASFTILPEIIQCKEFVNADEIARGLSPFQPETVAIEAGRIMLARMEDLLKAGESFAFETTLSTRSYKNTVLKAQTQGYTVTLLFFWLRDVALAKERVITRVSEGGHNIPEKIIERRYRNGILNLFDIYLPIVDGVMIYDNSGDKPDLVADKEKDTDLNVIQEEKFNKLKLYYEDKDQTTRIV